MKIKKVFVPFFLTFLVIFNSTAQEKNEKDDANLILQYLDSIKIAENELNYKKCITIGEKVLAYQTLHNEIKDTNYLSINQILFNAYLFYGNHAKALTIAKEDSALSLKFYDIQSLFYAKTLDDLSKCYRDCGKPELAELLALETEKVVRIHSHEYKVIYSIALNNLATVYMDQGKYEEAKEIFKKNIQFWKEQVGENDMDYASYLNNYANALQKTGNYKEAEKYFLMSLSVRDKLLPANPSTYASTLNNLANLYERTGRMKEAWSIYNQSKKMIYDCLGEKHPLFATVLNNMALWCEKQENYAGAEEFFLLSAENRRKNSGIEHPNYANSLSNLSRFYRKTGQYKKADSCIQTALGIFKNVFPENHPEYGNAVFKLGQLYFSTKEYKKADSLLKSGLSILKKTLGENHLEYLRHYFILARLHEKTDNYKEAIHDYEQILSKLVYQIQEVFPFLSEKEKFEFYITLQDYFEHFFEFSGRLVIQHSNAIRKLKKYQKIYPAETDTLTSFPSAKVHSLINGVVKIRMETKALLFNSEANIRRKVSEQKDTAVFELFRHWQNKRNQLSVLFGMSEAEFKKKGVDPEKIKKQITMLEKSIADKISVFRSSKSDTAHDVYELIQNLDKQEAAVEIIRCRKLQEKTEILSWKNTAGKLKNYLVEKENFSDSVQYMALIIKGISGNKRKKGEAEHADSLFTNLRLVILDEGNALEQKYYPHYKNCIKEKISDNVSYDRFWRKISSALTGISKIYFSADGVYLQMNPGTFLNPVSGKYLNRELDIINITNLKDVIQIKRDREVELRSAQQVGDVILIGGVDYSGNAANTDYDIPFLEGSSKETESIDSLLRSKGWKIKNYSGKSAPETILQNAGNNAIIHIATHAYFLNQKMLARKKILGIDSSWYVQNPLLKSGILMSASGSSENTISWTDTDGILTGYDIMNLELNGTRLAVLSACETGRGDVMTGEGVYGLQRAFRTAGVKSVIMSLWKVNDYTTQCMMKWFYEELSNGKNLHDAFRLSEKKMQENFMEPYYWGGFVLVGE